MKNLLACLALCASLSASAQGDNCTVLGIQDLTQMVFDLQAQLNAQDATMDSLQNASMTRDSVRAIARGEAAFWGSVGHADLEGVNLENNSNDGLISLAYLVGANFAGANLSGAVLSGVNLSGAYLSGAAMTCLRYGCPSSLPTGYTCEPDPDCSEPDRYRIVPE